jgi:hypothetical protein
MKYHEQGGTRVFHDRGSLKLNLQSIFIILGIL